MKAPKQILEFLEKPETFDRKSFETAMRNEVETVRGELTPSESLLVGMLVMTVETLMQAHQTIQENGYTTKYHAGEGTSAHFKARTECLDKVVKLLRELDIMKRTAKKSSEIDELFTVD
jgi:hypothetical protein